jgi:hypothetical protein
MKFLIILILIIFLIWYLHYDNKLNVSEYDIKVKNNDKEIISIVAVYPRNDNYKNILRNIYKYSKQVIFVYSTNKKYDIDFDYIYTNFPNTYIKEVENKGYDMFKYNEGLKYIINNNISYDYILLTNDSFKFTRDISDFFIL